MHIFVTCLILYMGKNVFSLNVTIEDREYRIWRWSYRDQDTSIRPFTIQFTKKMIFDLKFRINNRRDYTPALKGVGFDYGYRSHRLTSWLNYWINEYDFSEQEAFLNQFPQYKTNIQGLDIHFLWIKPKVFKGKKVLPLLLLHGFPGSVREFYKTIPLLTASNNGKPLNVEVIAPSLPGFGFSDGATCPGLGASEMATVFKLLMQRLGFNQFYVQGGDWGSIIGSMIATLYPEETLGFHTNFAISFSPLSIGIWFFGSVAPYLVADSSVEDRLYPLSESLTGLVRESGYLHIQATKPDTLGIAMSDSPVGLLAWILQLVALGTGRSYDDDAILEMYTRDEILDNIMLYWAPNCFTTSVRIYAETFNLRNVEELLYATPTPVPTWTAHTKYEIRYQSPIMLRVKYPNLLNSTVYEDYGHFFAFEAPDVFADNVLDALNAFEQWHAKIIKDDL